MKKQTKKPKNEVPDENDPLFKAAVAGAMKVFSTKVDNKEAEEERKRRYAFRERVFAETSHRMVSRGAEELEEKYVAQKTLLKFLMKERGVPELGDEQWERLMDVMGTLHMNRMFGYCPFPGTELGGCNYYKTCKKPGGCNADVCTNGYPSRMS
jgi:hypothetical protein